MNVFAASKRRAGLHSPPPEVGVHVLPLLRRHACEGVAMPVRICSWEQTAAKFTAVPPASPGQAGVATPVTKQPTPQRVG